MQSLRLQTSQSDPLSIRNCPHLEVSIRTYSYLKVRGGNERDVVRIYWYLSALCRFNGAHQSADSRPHFCAEDCGRLRFDPKLSVRVRKCVCVCDWGISDCHALPFACVSCPFPMR